MKSVLVIYEKVDANTKRIAMSLSRGLEAGGLYVDCISIPDIQMDSLNNYDVIGIGGHTYNRGITKKMKNFLSTLIQIRLKGKLGFSFETRANLRFAGSAAKKIRKGLEKGGIKIIYYKITRILQEKDGSLKPSTLNKMEQIGLSISDKLNEKNQEKQYSSLNNEPSRSLGTSYLNRIKRVFLSGGSLFFCIRAIQMASTGGDCFGTFHPLASWSLLFSEIFISGLVGLVGVLSAIILLKANEKKYLIDKFKMPQIIIFGGLLAFIMHFIRLGFWLSYCVL